MSDRELSDFHVRVPGKWVLAGEHSVLKGATAVALPHPEFALELSFKSAPGGLRVLPADAQKVVTELTSRLQSSPQDLSGELRIQSTIPVGAGLGSSAALCVAITRWLSEPLRIPQADWVATATQLEHHFHGKSSGMDVAVICAGKPVAFSMRDGAKSLALQRLPRFTFHDTGLRASTKECIQKVEDFRAQNASAAQIDDQMKQAAQAALAGLTLYDQGDRAQGLDLVAQAMTQGQSCFEAWGLMPAQAQPLKTQLLEQGARAVKLTGAGGGGMVVALWE